MVQAQRIILDSDYPAEKQLTTVLNVEVNVSSFSLAPDGSMSFSSDVDIPSGRYIEGTYIKSTLDPSDRWVSSGGSMVTYINESNWDEYCVYAVMNRISSAKMRLQVVVYNQGNSSNITVAAHKITAKVHLSVSPFD